MCGIVGIIGKSAVADRIVGSLKLLEYRGYDSAGISVIDNKEMAHQRKEMLILFNQKAYQ